MQDKTNYETIGQSIGKLVNEKQAAYGSAVNNIGKVLEILYPDGIRPEQYIDLGFMVRIVDKQFRIANKKGAFGESPYRDISGYSMLGFVEDMKYSVKVEQTTVPDPNPEDDIKLNADIRKDLKEINTGWEKLQPTIDYLLGQSKKVDIVWGKPQPPPIRDSIQVFAEAMDKDLEGTMAWETEALCGLLSDLEDECKKLRLAFQDYFARMECSDGKELMAACCRVANQAMMIFSQLNPLTGHNRGGYVQKRMPKMEVPDEAA